MKSAMQWFIAMESEQKRERILSNAYNFFATLFSCSRIRLATISRDNRQDLWIETYASVKGGCYWLIDLNNNNKNLIDWKNVRIVIEKAPMKKYTMEK